MDYNDIKSSPDNERKSSKIWRNIGIGVLAFFLSAITVIIIYL